MVLNIVDQYLNYMRSLKFAFFGLFVGYDNEINELEIKECKISTKEKF